MLYDPKWEKPSLAGFVAWLERQPPEKSYVWMNICGECAVSQYFLTFAPEEEHGDLWDKYGQPLDMLAMDGTRTFGALLDRARAALGHD